MQNKPILYAKVLKKILEKRSPSGKKEMIARFVQLLKQKGDLKLGGKIVQEFRKLWEERKGKRALLVSAFPLSQTQKRRVRKILQRQKYVYNEKIDPALVGGVSLYLGNEYLVDNSIKRKLLNYGKRISY